MMENYGISDYRFYKTVKNLEMQLYPEAERNDWTFKVVETIVNVEFLTIFENETKKRATLQRSIEDQRLVLGYGLVDKMNLFYERYSDKERANEAYSSAAEAQSCMEYFAQTLFKPKASRQFRKGFILGVALSCLALLIFWWFF